MSDAKDEKELDFSRLAILLSPWPPSTEVVLEYLANANAKTRERLLKPWKTTKSKAGRKRKHTEASLAEMLRAFEALRKPGEKDAEFFRDVEDYRVKNRPGFNPTKFRQNAKTMKSLLGRARTLSRKSKS